MKHKTQDEDEHNVKTHNTAQKKEKKRATRTPQKNGGAHKCSRRVRGCCSLSCYKNYTCINIASQINIGLMKEPPMHRTKTRFPHCDVQPSEREEVTVSSVGGTNHYSPLRRPSEREEVAASSVGERIITRP
jgi:hypothetical protein